MKTYESTSSWIERREELIHHGLSTGFVPTMGALHPGHLSLVEKAKKENDFVIASIFVNPTQFNSTEDLEKYPRSLDTDLEQLRNCGADAVLIPHAAEIYADHFQFKVNEDYISKILCGAHRPGHFNGVLTVVLKLLGLVQPSRCYMGEKDYQQYLLIQKMAEALFLRTKIVACPTLREDSGLALSSRNQRLTPEAHSRASLIYKYLSSAHSCEEAKNQLTESGFQVDYVEEHWGRRFVAAHIENVRLIDNVKI